MAPHPLLCRWPDIYPGRQGSGTKQAHLLPRLGTNLVFSWLEHIPGAQFVMFQHKSVPITNLFLASLGNRTPVPALAVQHLSHCTK